MKKLIFTFLTMVVFAFVANTTFAQSSATPYPGGTYSYTLDGLDDVDYSRTVRVFLDNDAIEMSPDLEVAGVYNVTHDSLNVTEETTYFDIDLPANTTSLTFNIEYETISTGAYELYLALYDGADTECYNFIYKEIVVSQNSFDLAMGPDFSDCQTIDDQPEADTPASSGQSTIFSYRVAKSGGGDDDDWGFDFDIAPNGLELDIDDITDISVEITTGEGTNSVTLTGDATSGDYAVRVTNDDTDNNATAVRIYVTVPTTTGVADAAFAGTVSAAKLYDGSTNSVTMDTESDSTNNEQIITLETIPSIGTFQ